MDTSHIVVLDPTAEGGTDPGKLSTRLKSLQSKKIAFIWNSKKNGDVVLRGVLDGLQQAGLAVEDVWFQKHMSEALSDKVIDEVTKVAEAAVLAVSD